MTAATRSIRCVFTLIFFLLIFASVQTAFAQEEGPQTHTARTPTGALWRSALVPGWGQAYNGQYLKLPFVYGAIGGLLFAAIKIGEDYKLYRNAFLYKAFQEQVDSGLIEVNPYETNQSSYDELAAKFGQISSSPLRAQRDTLRRNRDFSYLGVGLVYALSVLDAYVSAHLLDFNVDENLAFRINPVPNGVRFSGRIILP
ncbi:MAG: hypothetical protein BMS9Abin05_1454 [Rhodothermia bacterium]|nr:MAG: hypothetical protein BMS9Abin05_1454 [Rhodothermia bacterium]